MKKYKWLVVILVSLVIVAATLVINQRIIRNKEKIINLQAIREKNIIRLMYASQNEAFFGVSVPEFKPYDESRKYYLQMHINAYVDKTGGSITIADVEIFLEQPENSDGTPRTFFDDETGVIYAFVRWCESNNHYVNSYENDLIELLSDYRLQNPDCPYRMFSTLSAEQITELHKKYKDPEYILNL